MLESNIVAESNVYLSRTDSPYWDTDFIAQIKDYELLKHIESKRQSDRWIASFSDSQRRMLEIDMRCTFAKKDPPVRKYLNVTLIIQKLMQYFGQHQMKRKISTGSLIFSRGIIL